MPKFHVTKRQACIVSWIYEIEAETEAKALDKYINGDVKPIDAGIIGESIDSFQCDLDIKKIQ